MKGQENNGVCDETRALTELANNLNRLLMELRYIEDVVKNNTSKWYKSSVNAHLLLIFNEIEKLKQVDVSLIEDVYHDDYDRLEHLLYLRKLDLDNINHERKIIGCIKSSHVWDRIFWWFRVVPGKDGINNRRKPSTMPIVVLSVDFLGSVHGEVEWADGTRDRFLPVVLKEYNIRNIAYDTCPSIDPELIRGHIYIDYDSIPKRANYSKPPARPMREG